VFSKSARFLFATQALAARHPKLSPSAAQHPLDFVPIVDLDERRVVRIERPWGAAPPPVPAAPGNFHRRLGPPPRAGLRALDVLQPDGPSFAVEGNEIAWQKWCARRLHHSLLNLFIIIILFI
jgi:Cu2+-containing amine oxidase